MSPERVREVRQLWAVVLYEGRTYRDLLAGFRKTAVPERDLIVLGRSADLDSAAIRLASLDELLNGGCENSPTRKTLIPRRLSGPRAIWRGRLGQPLLAPSKSRFIYDVDWFRVGDRIA